MKRNMFPVIVLPLLLLSEVVHAQPQSRVEMRSHFSATLGITKNYYVYLPAEYDNASERYPVIYFLRLHEYEWFDPGIFGRSGGKTLKHVADDLVASEQIGKVILVCPSTGSDNGAVGGPAVNMLRPELAMVSGIGTGRFEDYIIQDLIPHIDSTLRTIPDRAHRALDGFSFGGYSSTMLSLRHPSLFLSVGSYDGAIMWYDLDNPNTAGPEDDWLWLLNTLWDPWLSPVFDRPRNVPYMLQHSASNILKAADSSQLDSIQMIRFHISIGSKGENYGKNFQLLDIMLEKGIRNSFCNPIVAPDAIHNWHFADIHAATSLVRHWQAFAEQKLNAPLAIDFGIVEVGKSDTSNILAFNYSTTPLIVSSALNYNPDYTPIDFPASPRTLPGRYDTLSFNVIFSPTSHGMLDDTLIIATNDNANPNTSIMLQGSGFFIGRAEIGTAYAAGGTSSQLFKVDLATGAATPIGFTGTTTVRGLAIHPATKEIYAVVPAIVTTDLYRVSVQSGEALLAATIPVGNIWGIEFHPDGTLFGATATGQLCEIKPSTGEATQIGSPSGIAYSGLSFNPFTNKLYASHFAQDKIYTVDPNTGVATLVGSTGMGGNNDIAFNPQGVLCGITRTNDFIHIDTTTANGTLIGPMGFPGMSAFTMRSDSILVSVDEANEAPLVKNYHLGQNYPNPFNSQTVIEYQIPSAGHLRVSIYNLLGQRVLTLVDKRHQAGRFNLIWDGKDYLGKSVPSGVYFCKMEAEGFTETKKMLLLE